MPIILPTPRGWVVMMAGGAWFAVALVNHMIFPFLLAGMAAALTAASLLSSLLVLRGLRLERGVIGNAAAGQAISMPIQVRNLRSWRRQPFVLIERVPFSPEGVHRTVVPSLRPEEERWIPRRVLAMKRGEYRLDRVTVRSGDPAGLFRCDIHFSWPRKLLILPGTESVPDLLLRRRESMNSVSGNPVSSAGMGQDFYGVREYNSGDGLRFIHWKSSARYGRLMVREFERSAVVSVAVLLDADEHFVSGDDAWSNIEYQIRAVASLSKYCSDLYCSFALGAGGRNRLVMPAKPAAEANQDIFYELAMLQPGPIQLHEVAYELCRDLPRETIVFCFSLSLNKRLAEALEVLVSRGMTVRWYCARRSAFEQIRSHRSREALVAERISGKQMGQVVAAQLGPGTSLEQAFTFFA